MWFPSTVDKMQNIFGLEIELNDFIFYFFLSLAILQKINPSYCMSNCRCSYVLDKILWIPLKSLVRWKKLVQIRSWWTTKSILSDIIGVRIVRLYSCHQHLRKFIQTCNCTAHNHRVIDPINSKIATFCLLMEETNAFCLFKCLNHSTYNFQSMIADNLLLFHEV
jgi:hypothetical protein